MELRQEMSVGPLAVLRQLWDRDTEPTEVIANGFALYWAVLLASPATTFGTSPGYAAMARRGSENWWAACFAVVVLTALAAMWRGSLTLRLASLGGHVLLWAFVATMVWSSAPVSAGVGVYGLTALGVSWVFCRKCGENGTELVAAWKDAWGRVWKRGR